jgi:hypothetical protein
VRLDLSVTLEKGEIMLATTIIMAAVALIAGYAGAQWQKKRQGCVTKREADRLIKSVAEMREVFDEHMEVHRIMKYQIETLGQNMTVIGEAVGMEQPRHLH